ncbi:hypothetical protein, partial [Scytonema sp. PCC 10023]|uniref:hypothetical protein n=1 Tax=Scytonema sp. PCC 10023 TaxID=1680591 RepID=UPI0039C70B16
CLCLPASRYYAVFKVLAGLHPAVLLFQARLLKQFLQSIIAFSQYLQSQFWSVTIDLTVSTLTTVLCCSVVFVRLGSNQ